MADKTWRMAFGERSGDSPPADEVLGMTVADAKRRRLERQMEIEDLEYRRKRAEMEKERRAAEIAVDKPSDSGFKISGGVNLGTIDLQEERRRAEEKSEKIAREKEQTLNSLADENSKLRDSIHAKDIDTLRMMFGSQMENLQRLIEQGNNSKKAQGDWYEEYQKTISIAQELGLQAPKGEVSDISIQLQLKKMDYDHSMEMRRFDREAKHQDRQFSLELKRMEREDRHAAERIQIEREKMQGLFQAPKMVGNVIAKALMEGAGGGGNGGGAVQSGGQITLEADAGEAGETECPQCAEPVGIGPNSKRAVCSGCGQDFVIKRNNPQTTAEEVRL